MQAERRISDELRGHVDPSETEAFDSVGMKLEAERPLPRAAFRAELRRRLTLPGRQRSLPPHRLRLWIGAYLTSGFALLLVAAVGLTGAGPLGY
jgi:hypothetical protein